ncbi:MAG: hypothetical protein IPK03_04320 [Bacteroidetes bacterium]|nr:hypothetical protein [Bacteroidota bacterium]
MAAVTLGSDNITFNKGANAYLYENLMAMDKENGIVVIEHAFDDSDTVLIAENILTRKDKLSG